MGVREVDRVCCLVRAECALEVEGDLWVAECADAAEQRSESGQWMPLLLLQFGALLVSLVVVRKSRSLVGSVEKPAFVGRLKKFHNLVSPFKKFSLLKSEGVNAQNLHFLSTISLARTAAPAPAWLVCSMKTFSTTQS